MTPAAVLAGIPADLLRRRTSPNDQLGTAKRLAQWLDERGHRPTWLEIEQERARRDPNPRRQPERRKARP